MSWLLLKAFDGSELIIHENHIVKIHRKDGWGSQRHYEIHLVDGRENALSLESGKRLWERLYAKCHNLM
jgi:hypothetical protein